MTDTARRLLAQRRITTDTEGIGRTRIATFKGPGLSSEVDEVAYRIRLAYLFAASLAAPDGVAHRPA